MPKFMQKQEEYHFYKKKVKYVLGWKKILKQGSDQV